MDGTDQRPGLRDIRRRPERASPPDRLASLFERAGRAAPADGGTRAAQCQLPDSAAASAGDADAGLLMRSFRSLSARLTVQFALGNAAARLRVGSAFIVSADGRVSATGHAVGRDETAALWEPLDEGR